jgi:hypothetical protein
MDRDHVTNIPVRLSVDDVSNGVVTWEVASRIDVFLDGVKQPKAVAYDIEAGTVTRLLVDAKGNLLIDWVAGEVRRETLTGKVEVKLSEDAETGSSVET